MSGAPDALDFKNMRGETASLLRAIAAAAIASASASSVDSGGNSAAVVAAAERVTRDFLDKLNKSAPSTLHVLVVDDDKFIRDTLSRMVRPHFFLILPRRLSCCAPHGFL